jgi:hypothetical protein
MSDRNVDEKLAEAMAAMREQTASLKQQVARAKAEIAQRAKIIRQNELAQKPAPPPQG